MVHGIRLAAVAALALCVTHGAATAQDGPSLVFELAQVGPEPRAPASAASPTLPGLEIPPPNPNPDPRRSPDTAEANLPDEVVVLNLGDDDRARLIAGGYTVLEETALPGLDTTLLRLRIPPQITLTDAWRIIRALPTGEISDFNHLYRPGQGADCPGSRCPERALVGWNAVPSRDAACGRGVTIGMIDSGLNTGHPTFAGAALDVLRLPHPALPPAPTVHGTAVAALLVGDPASRSPGLVPGARLVAVEAFHRNGSDARADLGTLIEAISLLVEREVDVINLSLAGAHNLVLEYVIAELTQRYGIVVVAAVGNAGPDAKPAYPAAYDSAIAVTAVDRGGVLYRNAVRGAHVDLAAPGVEVWTAASLKGARWKTGTSFAAPFVTAAAALLLSADPSMRAETVAAALRIQARDLGDPGVDPSFGAGLVRLDRLCGPN